MSRPTPPPSPPPPAPSPTLPAEINAATRKQHIVLNRMIVDRLPLALPPNAKNPFLYGYGLAAFAQIYFLFERLWPDIALNTEPGALGGTHDAQLRQWLDSLQIEGLLRSPRLKADLKHLSEVVGTADGFKHTVRLPASDWMEKAILARPHILVAYSWVMYMAIFSGGRWIRQQMAHGGPGFWQGEHGSSGMKKTADLSGTFGFSFLSFDGDQDGEDIKTLFKAHLAEAEVLLTQQERQDIIIAAQQLFEDCIALVRELDYLVWRRKLLDKLPALSLSIGVLLALFVLYRCAI